MDTWDHTTVLTTISVHLSELQQQGKEVCVTWVPSHCGIVGNEAADVAASTALSMAGVSLTTPPSLPQVKSHVRRQASRLNMVEHLAQIVVNYSRSCTWYRAVTEYEPAPISRHTPRKTAVILHRLRLGYHCFSELHKEGEEPDIRECEHCEELTIAPLFHYLLHCPALTHIRPPGLVNLPLDSPDVSRHAAEAARAFLVHPQVVTTFPPPR